MRGELNMPLPEQETRYTYKQYLEWPEEERWELIEGVPCMQAAPSWQHPDRKPHLWEDPSEKRLR